MTATETVTPTCLTEPQIDVVQKLYGGPVDAEGRALYPGHEAVGSELAWGQFVLGPAGMTPMAALIANGYLKYLGFPASPAASFSYKDWKFTLEGFDLLRPMGEVYNATNPDLSAFVTRGGKLILYHGWADPAIPPYGTIAYYQAVQDTMGGSEATQEFARLYMVPGMYHCSGGDAPNSFDLLTLIQAWVENGVAPQEIIATQYSSSGSSGGFADPTAGGGSGEVVRTRPLCPYPLQQTYTGTGDINDPANFDCTMPESEALIDGHYDWVGNDLFEPIPAEPVAALSAESAVTGTVVSDSRVNVRSAPGTDAAIIDKLEPGTQVTVAGRTAASDWLWITLESGAGWVAAELIQLAREPAPLPVVAP